MTLISKKDLLSLTGISYGQLYRWKRERLIPEEWFGKQSAFTGQETFFPREQVLERVKSILALKDTHSLEELAQILSTGGDKTVSSEDIRKLEGFGRSFFYDLAAILGKREFTLIELGFAAGISVNADKTGLTDFQCRNLILACAPTLEGMQRDVTVCTLFETGGVIHACFTWGAQGPVFTTAVRVLVSFSLDDMVNLLKSRLCGKTDFTTE